MKDYPAPEVLTSCTAGRRLLAMGLSANCTPAEPEGEMQIVGVHPRWHAETLALRKAITEMLIVDMGNHDTFGVDRMLAESIERCPGIPTERGR